MSILFTERKINKILFAGDDEVEDGFAVLPTDLSFGMPPANSGPAIRGALLPLSAPQEGREDPDAPWDLSSTIPPAT